MTFFEEVRKIFKTYDPGRLYLSKRIAKKYKSKSKQKAVIEHLLEVYRNGGVDAIDLTKKEVKKIEAVETEVIEEVIEEIPEVTNEVEESFDDDETATEK